MSSCKNMVERLFPEKYEVKIVNDLGDSCGVDFKDKEIVIDVDWNPYCEERCNKEEFIEEDEESGEYKMVVGSDEYDKCFDDCMEEGKEIIKDAKLGSMVFRKKDLVLMESTIPIDCNYVWNAEGLEEQLRMEGVIRENESWDDYQERMQNRFRNLGCYVSDEWVHPHELIHLGEELEEEPAACDLHLMPESAEPKCKIDDVFNELKKL